MKWKVRVVIFMFTVFMLVVSFKILEPEMFNDQNVSSEQALEKGVPVDLVVSNLVDNYKLEWKSSLKESPWKVAAKWVNWRQIIPPNAPELGAIMHELSTRPIVSADVGYKGTQLKLSLVLKGGQVVAFKPQWYVKSHIIKGSPYSGRDRHNAEIVAFHLGRLLEFRQTPLAVGRLVNLQTEIMPVATPELLATFFTKDNDTCFYGKCYYCKGPKDGVCGNGPHIEGTIVLWLPNKWNLKTARHPWSRTYNDGKLAKWETDQDYCNKVEMIPLFQKGPRLLDLIDTAIFDYLTGNADRHHYEYFTGNKNAAVLMLDNGKGLGNPNLDEKSILAPLYQCCKFRFKTWQRLLALQDGILSSVLRELLKQDPLNVVVTENHLAAMDRRLRNILMEMEKCVATYGVKIIITEVD